MTNQAADLPLELIAPRVVDMSWKVEKAVEWFLSFDFPDGEIITHQMMAAFIGVPPRGFDPELKAKTAEAHQLKRVDRIEALFGRLLVDHRIAFITIVGTGYQILPPADQAVVAYDDLQKSLKKSFRDSRLMQENTRVEKLSPRERLRHTEAVNKRAALEQIINSRRPNFLKGEVE